jgi:hypothetical protein
MSLTIGKLEKFGENVIAEIITAMLENDAVATGETLRSLSSFTTFNASEERVTIVGGDAFALNKRGETFLEDGRGVGKMPPYQQIANWAIARQIITDEESGKSIIFAIRNKIAKEGTRIWRREDDFRNIAKEIITEKRIEDLIAELSDSIFFEVSSEIYKINK